MQLSLTSPTAEASHLPPLSRAAWGVAIALWLMFTGMMHDFRSVRLSTVEMEDAMLDQGVAFEKDVTAALPERKLAFVVSAMIAVFTIATATRRVVWQSKLLVALVAMALGWIYLSWLWSVDRGETARELVRVSVYAALAYGISIRFTPLDVVRIVVVFSTLTVLETIAYEVFIGAPASADGVYRLTGSLHPNPLGRFAMLMAIPALGFAWTMRDRRWTWIAVLTIGLVVLQLTRSRTAMASCIVGLGVVVALGGYWRRLVPIGIAGGLAAGMLLLAIGLQGQSGVEGVGSTVTMGRDDQVGSLTGRLPLWEVVLEKSADFRLQGSGYGAFWSADMNEAVHDDAGWFAGHSHSCYVELIVNLGVIGMVLVVAAGSVALGRAVTLARATRRVEYSILAAVLASAFVNGLTESGFVLPRELAILSATLIITLAQAPTANTAPTIDTRRFALNSLSQPVFR